MSKIKVIVEKTYKNNYSGMVNEAMEKLDEIAISKLNELKQLIGKAYFAQIQEEPDGWGLLATHMPDAKHFKAPKKRKPSVPVVKRGEKKRILNTLSINRNR